MGPAKLVAVIGLASFVILLANAASIKTPDDSCVCTREYVPICGSDNVTYDNNCVFECEKKNNKGLEALFDGECGDRANPDMVKEDFCACSREFRPVCSTDNTTYTNDCMMRCKNGVLAYYGQCTDAKATTLNPTEDEANTIVGDSQQDDCICPDIYNPICGSNDKTYSNKCEFDCATKLDYKLEIKNEGECRAPTLPTKKCQCTIHVWLYTFSRRNPYSTMQTNVF